MSDLDSLLRDAYFDMSHRPSYEETEEMIVTERLRSKNFTDTLRRLQEVIDEPELDVGAAWDCLSDLNFIAHPKEHVIMEACDD